MPRHLNPADVKAFYSQYVLDLQTYGQGNSAVGLCPFHDDHDRSFSIDLTTGRYNCFSDRCKMSGNVISFARQLKLTIPAWAGGRDYRRIYSKVLANDKTFARDYLLRRAVNKEYIDYLDFAGLFAYDEYKDEPALIFPVFDRFGTICALNKVNLENRDKRTIGSPLGGYWIDTNFEFKGAIYLVEAVINAISLSQFEIPSLAMITAGNTYEPDMFQGLDVVIVTDNDAAGRAAARRLSREVLVLAHSVRVVRWSEKASRGFDPNDVIQQVSNPIEYFALMDKSATSVDEWSDFVNFSKLINAKRANEI